MHGYRAVGGPVPSVPGSPPPFLRPVVWRCSPGHVLPLNPPRTARQHRKPQSAIRNGGVRNDRLDMSKTGETIALRIASRSVRAGS